MYGNQDVPKFEKNPYLVFTILVIKNFVSAGFELVVCHVQFAYNSDQ